MIGLNNKSKFFKSDVLDSETLNANIEDARNKDFGGLQSLFGFIKSDMEYTTKPSKSNFFFMAPSTGYKAKSRFILKAKNDTGINRNIDLRLNSSKKKNALTS